MTKIAIIGAGSLVLSSRLTAGILTYPALTDSHFALVDIDAERLDYAGRIVERIFREGGYDEATQSLHQDRRIAVGWSCPWRSMPARCGHPVLAARLRHVVSEQDRVLRSA